VPFIFISLKTKTQIENYGLGKEENFEIIWLKKCDIKVRN
jgi:hypothetical protein